MNNSVIDLTTVPDSSYTKLPDGQYDVVVEKVERKALKDANAGDKLVITYSVISGPYMGKKFSIQHNVWHTKSAETATIALQEIKRLGYTVGVFQITNGSEFLQKTLRVETKIDGDYMRINGYFRLDGTVADTTGAPAQPAMPQATAPAPVAQQPAQPAQPAAPVAQPPAATPPPAPQPAVQQPAAQQPPAAQPPADPNAHPAATHPPATVAPLPAGHQPPAAPQVVATPAVQPGATEVETVAPPVGGAPAAPWGQ